MCESEVCSQERPGAQILSGIEQQVLFALQLVCNPARTPLGPPSLFQDTHFSISPLLDATESGSSVHLHTHI